MHVPLLFFSYGAGGSRCLLPARRMWSAHLRSNATCAPAACVHSMSYDSNCMVSDLFAPPTDELSEVMRVYQSDLLTNSVPMDAQARPCVHEQGCPL